MIPDRLTVLVSSSSSMNRLASVSIVGSSLSGLTVTVNVLVVVSLSLVVASLPSRPASSTVTVIRALPEASATGVSLIDPVELADA